MWLNPINGTRLEHPEWGNSVMRNGNGSVKDPMEESESLCVFLFNFFNCLLALPLNVYVTLIILLKKHLRTQSKYVIRLNAFLCNLLTLFFIGQETVYYFLPSQELCHSYVSTLGISSIAFLFNVLLSLIKRSVAIAYPVWHHKHITPKVVVIWSLILNLLLAVALDWVYVFDVAPIRCAYQKDHIRTLIATWVTLFISCPILIALIRYKTRPPNPTAAALLVQAATQEDLQLIAEKESAYNFATGLIPLLFIPLVVVITSLPAIVCLQFFHPDDATCAALVSWTFYQDKLISLNALVSPLLIIRKNAEFHSPFFAKLLKRCCPSFMLRLFNFLSTIV